LIKQRHQKTRWNLWSTTAVLLIVIGWLGIQWPHHSLWYDETLTAWVASGPLERLIHWCTQVDIQVPFHYLVLRGWMAFAGDSEFSLHLLSALCGLLAVAGLIVLVRRLAGQLPAVVAGLLLGLCPGFLWIAFEVRAYALALALSVWATVFLLDLLKPNVDRRVMIAYWLLIVAALYTHYTALALIASHALIVIVTVLRRHDGSLARRMIVLGGLIALGFLPWLPVLFTRGTGDQSFYTGSSLPDQTLGVIFSFKWLARDDFKWTTPDQLPTDLVPFMLVGLALLIGGVVLWVIRRQRWTPILYGLALALPSIVMIIVVVYFKPKLAGRYAWPAWIGIDVLAACAIVAIGSVIHRYRRMLPIVIACVLLAIPWLSNKTGHPPNSDFRGAFAYIRDHWHEGDQVVLRDGTLFPAAEYYRSPSYIRLPNNANLTDTNHVLHVDEAVKLLTKQPDSIRGVWIVAWQPDVMDPQNMTTGLIETLGIRQAVPEAWGDVGLRYYSLQQPLSMLRVPELAAKPLVVLPNGLSLSAVKLITPGPLHPGDRIITHSWWWRPGPVNSAARVSVRLMGPDDRAYAQMDQPPSGWFYFPDHWPDNMLILGRYEMQIPPDIGEIPLTMKLVVYSADNDFAPVAVTVGTVQIEPAS
jgi:mannosyltransferase